MYLFISAHMFLCFHVVGRCTLRWPRNWTIYFTKHVVGRCTLRWNSDYIFQFLCCWYVSYVKVYNILEFPCCLEVLECPKKTNLLIFNSIQTCIWVVLIKNGKTIHLGHFTQNFGSSVQYEGKIEMLWKFQQLYRIAARFSRVQAI